MIKWEYKTVEGSYLPRDILLNVLNEQGSLGWELVTLELTPDHIISSIEICYIFKRRLRGKPARLEPKQDRDVLNLGTEKKTRIEAVLLDALRLHEFNLKGLQEYVYTHYVDADMLHEKTVGMTLYRMKCKGIVKREGRIWSLIK